MGKLDIPRTVRYRRYKFAIDEHIFRCSHSLVRFVASQTLAVDEQEAKLANKG